jgi:DNA adenine methylase
MRKTVPTTKISYLEPFCGALGVFRHMSQYGYRKCIGSDLQPDIIRLWKAVKTGTLRLPGSVSKDQYKARCLSKRPSALRAALGFGLGYRGVFCSGFDNGSSTFAALTNSFESTGTYIKSNPRVSFVHKDYRGWRPRGVLIYCDPPYKASSKRSTFRGVAPCFDHQEFWDTMRRWSQNNYVFVSELQAPKDFKCIWSKKVPVSIEVKNRKNYRQERLFVLRKSLADARARSSQNR